MSEVKKSVEHMSTGRPEAGAHYAALYNEAQFELAALREELATLHDQHAEQSCIFCNDSGQLLTEVKSLRKRLTASEQRNAELEAQVDHKNKGIEFRDVLINAVSMSSKELLMAWVPSDWEAKRACLLSNAQPTEAGASE
jgi:DNA repair exonuclease SbcCD ATPase subunit